MNEALTIRTERVDDIPLLLAQMERMGIARLLDAHFPTHGNREGLSLGVVTSIWLTHVLSQADHRMNRVQEWVSRRLSTLRGCGLADLTPLDVTDDRLADVLRKDEVNRAVRALTYKLKPASLPEALEHYWELKLEGKEKEGLALLRRLGEQGVPLPFDIKE